MRKTVVLSLLFVFGADVVADLHESAPTQNDLNGTMPDYRFVASVAKQVSCQMSETDPFYYEHFDLEATFTNLGPVALSFFDGDASNIELAGPAESEAMRERYAGAAHWSPDRIPEGQRQVVLPGESLSWRVATGLLFRKSRGDERFRGAGRYDLRVVSYRRRLATAEEVAATGMTRTWVRLISAPVDIEVQAPAALPLCPEDVR